MSQRRCLEPRQWRKAPTWILVLTVWSLSRYRFQGLRFWWFLESAFSVSSTAWALAESPRRGFGRSPGDRRPGRRLLSGLQVGAGQAGAHLRGVRGGVQGNSALMDMDSPREEGQRRCSGPLRAADGGSCEARALRGGGLGGNGFGQAWSLCQGGAWLQTQS